MGALFVAQFLSEHALCLFDAFAALCNDRSLAFALAKLKNYKNLGDVAVERAKEMHSRLCLASGKISPFRARVYRFLCVLQRYSERRARVFDCAFVQTHDGAAPLCLEPETPIWTERVLRFIMHCRGSATLSRTVCRFARKRRWATATPQKIYSMR